MCLNIAFWQMCVTNCGRFDSNEEDVVGYVDRMRANILQGGRADDGNEFSDTPKSGQGSMV